MPQDRGDGRSSVHGRVALHCPLSPISLAASIQLDACLPNFLVQEHNEVNDWREDGRTYIGRGYLKDPFVLDKDGCVAVPSVTVVQSEPDSLKTAQNYNFETVAS